MFPEKDFMEMGHNISKFKLKILQASRLLFLIFQLYSPVLLESTSRILFHNRNSVLENNNSTLLTIAYQTRVILLLITSL